MRTVLVIIFCWMSTSLLAQVGRFEEPVDSIPIGGEIQEEKQNQMELQDDLTSQLMSVRDSLKHLPSNSVSPERKKELDETIAGLRNYDRSPELVKRGYTLLNEIRAELKSLEPSTGDRMRKD